MSSLDTLRRLALEGLPRAPVVSVPRKVRPASGPPVTPPHARSYPREPLPFLLEEQAERLWRQCAHPWSPTLSLLRAEGATARVQGSVLEVRGRTSSHRARGLPDAWLPVVLAALTGQELPAIRRALRAGEGAFAPEPRHG
ncbi:MAG: hypothetical protein HY909_11295 [Deltaproteobacteria bacterium]|nr:hypothetical protein [Deltaproteobacteria bacterium]